jgi:hypothetical protein
MASADSLSVQTVLLHSEQSLAPIGGRAGIGLPDSLVLALLGAALDGLDDKGEQKRNGKDGEKKIHYQPEGHSNVSPQACNVT